MIFDSHSHTEISSDSDMKALEAIDKADKLGIGIAFTEHYDFDYIASQNYDGKSTFRFDPEEYWQKYEKLRTDKVSLGVEVGMSLDTLSANIEFVEKVPFDIVVGSVHIIDKCDLYYKNFYTNKDKMQAYKKYLSIIAEMVKKHSYIDVMGHIDYICRYAPYDNKYLEYDVFSDNIDNVLLGLVENEIVMELNTRLIADENELLSLIPIYRKYRDLGGRYITLGSDAHEATKIGMNFVRAEKFARELELKIVTFRERKMQLC